MSRRLKRFFFVFFPTYVTSSPECRSASWVAPFPVHESFAGAHELTKKERGLATSEARGAKNEVLLRPTGDTTKEITPSFQQQQKQNKLLDKTRPIDWSMRSPLGWMSVGRGSRQDCRGPNPPLGWMSVGLSQEQPSGLPGG